MNNFKDLKVWQKSIALVTLVYQNIEELPQDEKYGLSSQMKRCANSIPSNIAEGAGRTSKKEFKYFLSVSKGSLNELQTQLIVSQKLNFLSLEKLTSLEEKIEEIGKMLSGLIKSLN
jgi:four helix bundle protein